MTVLNVTRRPVTVVVQGRGLMGFKGDKGDPAPNIIFQYSVNNIDWTTTATGAQWYRQSGDNGATWSEAIAISTTAYADAKVAESITEDVTGVAPSQAVVFDALALKLDSSDVAVTAAANKIPKADALGKINLGYLPDAQTTFATTSTNDATSPTAAPLKTAGGLAVAKSAWFGGPLKMVRLGTTAIRWIGEIPLSTTTAVTILSRSTTNGGRSAILTLYTGKNLGNAAVCGVAKYIIYPSLTFVIVAQWGASGSGGGYGSVVLSVDGNNLQATKADNLVGCGLELEMLQSNSYSWVSPSAEYFSV